MQQPIADTSPRLELDGPFGKEVYSLELFPTSAALEWQQRLANLGLEPLAMMMSEREYPWSNASDADLAVIARTLLSKLQQDSLATLIKGLTSGVYVLREGKQGGIVRQKLSDDFEIRFRGRMLDLYKMLGWVLQENFKDFTTAVRSIGEVLRQRYSKESPAADSETVEVTSPDQNPPSPSM